MQSTFQGITPNDILDPEQDQRFYVMAFAISSKQVGDQGRIWTTSEGDMTPTAVKSDIQLHCSPGPLMPDENNLTVNPVWRSFYAKR